MLIKPSAPWIYLMWRQPELTADQEVVIAGMVRREGIFSMLRIYWQIVTKEREDRTPYFDLDCAWIFFAKNYVPFLCWAGYLIGLSDCGLIALAWSITFLYGTVREAAWLLSLLYRWPPMAKG